MPSRSTQLHYLSAVADTGQITAAAKRLKVSQPTVSQGIAQLESELGVALLERHAHGVTLTPAGETFLGKARLALAAEGDAMQVGESLGRAARRTIAVGFVGPPPAMTLPELFVGFAQAHLDTQIDFRDLCFPCGATTSWMAGVDVAVCHRPRPEPGVEVHSLVRAPRTVLVRSGHPLAGREPLCAADVLGARFVGFHGDVQAEWAAFHTLDDVRGGPAACTDDRALTTLQMLAVLASGEAITVAPEPDALVGAQAMPGIVARPLVGVAPAEVCLVWRSGSPSPIVAKLAEWARGLPSRNGGAPGSAGGV